MHTVFWPAGAGPAADAHAALVCALPHVAIASAMANVRDDNGIALPAAIHVLIALLR